MATARKKQTGGANEVQLPPHSQDAEEALLGSLLMVPDNLNEVRTALKPEDFFILRHGWVYEAMLRLADRGDGIDVRTLAEELRAQGRLDDVGGEAYLNYLPTRTPTALNAPVYAVLIRRMALRRQLIAAASEVVTLAYDNGLEIEQVIDRAQAAVFAVAPARRNTLVTFETALSQVYDDMEAERDGQPSVLRMMTPWRDLNELIGGFEGKQLIIPAARPGRGKSAMMLQIATCAARQHLRVLIVSMEMSEREIIARIIAQETGVPTDLQRRMNDGQWREFLAWINNHSGALAGITFETSGNQTPLKIAALARDMRRRGELDLLVVDYLQLMQPDSKSDNRNNELTSIVRGLRQLAMELDIPVIAASQLNRDVTRAGRRPRLHHLRDSGALEADANMVMFIHQAEPRERDDDEAADGLQDGPAEFIVAKNRNGPTGVVPVVWFGSRMVFRDMAHQHQQPPS